jgi:hypothetical protein
MPCMFSLNRSCVTDGITIVCPSTVGSSMLVIVSASFGDAVASQLRRPWKQRPDHMVLTCTSHSSNAQREASSLPRRGLSDMMDCKAPCACNCRYMTRSINHLDCVQSTLFTTWEIWHYLYGNLSLWKVACGLQQLCRPRCNEHGVPSASGLTRSRRRRASQCEQQDGT